MAGSLIGINPFDQPDVEDAKVLAREITDRYDETGTLASRTPFVEDRTDCVSTPTTRTAPSWSGWPAKAPTCPRTWAPISLAPEPATTWLCSPTSR